MRRRNVLGINQFRGLGKICVGEAEEITDVSWHHIHVVHIALLCSFERVSQNLQECRLALTGRPLGLSASGNNKEIVALLQGKQHNILNIPWHIHRSVELFEQETVTKVVLSLLLHSIAENQFLGVTRGKSKRIGFVINKDSRSKIN